jgi:hypothetical protein
MVTGLETRAASQGEREASVPRLACGEVTFAGSDDLDASQRREPRAEHEVL